MKKLNTSGIDYLDYVFNPVTGCKKGCPYCWAQKKFHRFKKSWEPQFHPDRLEWPANTAEPGRVGVVFEGDLFGSWVPDEWIEQVFKACEAAPQHTYYFLTKNPKRYAKTNYSLKWWLGFSASDKDTYCHRPIDMPKLAKKYVSLEPLTGEVPNLAPRHRWVIVGAQTKPLVLPEKEWILDIRDQCAALGIPIFMKNNLAPLGLELIQQFPDQPPTTPEK